MEKIMNITILNTAIKQDKKGLFCIMLKHGTISYNQLKYHPIWDWKKRDLIDCFNKHKIKLPIDYKLFGRSFDGLDLRFLMPLKKHLPNDYKKILEWFPLAELEIFRYERSLNA
jgi:3'-phosphoadenosine 5'-phosphosulfate sulfotransferase (PAPS reductase)/FAD synthetase